MNKSSRPNVIVFAILLPLVIGLIAWGVLTHKEPGLLKACRNQTTGEAILSGSCFDLKWSKMPPWSVSGDVEHAAFSVDVVTTTNQMLGFRAFAYMPNVEGSPDISLFYDTIPVAGELPESGGATTTYYLGDNNLIKHVVVKAANITIEQVLYNSMVHELGHAAGLDHDDFTDSVMHDPPDPSSTFTDGDRALLHRLYVH